MQNMILGSLVTGYAVALIVHSLIKTVKRSDGQHGLPEKLSIADCLCLFLCGASSYQGLSITSAILFCVTVYMGFMAYTDRHTGTVYSAASYLLSIPGLCLLVFPVVRMDCLINLLIYGGIVLFGSIIKAYHWGDVQVFFALFPYYMMIPTISVCGMEIDSMGMLLFLFLFSLIVTLVFSIKIRPYRIVKKRPMVPAIAFVYSCTLFFLKFA